MLTLVNLCRPFTQLANFSNNEIDLTIVSTFSIKYGNTINSRKLDLDSTWTSEWIRARTAEMAGVVFL